MLSMNHSYTIKVYQQKSPAIAGLFIAIVF
jgi:hypothetical protein